MIDAFSKREERTIFAFAKPPNEYNKYPTFWLGMRSVNKKDEKKYLSFLEKSAGFSDKSFEITQSTSKPIKFCPWCGKNLLSKYKDSFQLLVDETILDNDGNLR